MLSTDFADLQRDWNVGEWIVTGSGEAGHVMDILESPTSGRVHILVMFARNIGNNEPDLLRIDPGKAGISGVQKWRRATRTEVEEAIGMRKMVLNDRIVEYLWRK